MTRQQEFRKQTEEAKLQAFSLMCEKVADLEKENAGQKERLELLNLNANIAVRDLNDLLTKAKEIIREIMKYDIPTLEYVKAEQFLKEIEK